MVYSRIAEFMRDKGITQSHVAKQTGLSANAVSQILKGERKITIEEYVGICAALGTSLDYFVD